MTAPQVTDYAEVRYPYDLGLQKTAGEGTIISETSGYSAFMPDMVVVFNNRVEFLSHETSAEFGPYLLIRKTIFADGTSKFEEYQGNVVDRQVIKAGKKDITPVANQVTSVDLYFPAGSFTTAPVMQVTANTSVPGTKVMEVSASNITKDGCKLNILRADTVVTQLHWMAIGN